MDLLEDFDFDFDPEEVMRRADGMSIIGSASASAVGPDNIGSPAEKRLNEVLHYPEGELAHHLSREERYVDSFEGMDDAALEEAMQHIPESFGYQMPPTERLLSPAPCVHSTSPYGITQNAQRTEHRALYCEYDTDLSNDVGDLLPSEALRYAKRCSDFEATNNEHYMEWMDDAAFEEAINREKDLRSPQLPEYLSMSSQHDTVSQRDARGAGRYASHQDSTPETMKEHRTQLTDDVSHACEPAKKPDEDLLQVEALSEALQYAYANNLTTDYLLTSSSITHLFGPLAQSTIPMTNNDGFTDHSHLSDAKLPNPVVSDQSKALTMTPFASGLIDEARQFQSEEAIQSLAEEVCNFDKFKTMRLELPILRTDNEWDLSVFQDLYLGRSESLLRSIKKHRLPLHPQNLEDGEGMELSSKDRAKIEGIMKRTEEEKVSVTKESLTYLVSQLQHDYPLEDRVQYMAGEIKYEKASISQRTLCTTSF
ncbi:hypothetical protein N0V93_007482 [Gnomoniopsis smithogilvyi]|uniref:Uncharacterized protein n=1 Tax=Gnomoniopsis smithogilvyi TaxID=1191159 RepID=A0A9W8YRX8_9PEZI|nr:hypothetical protein N0V93_007482 [Gnomoniopsis smithogilvyi]